MYMYYATQVYYTEVIIVSAINFIGIPTAWYKRVRDQLKKLKQNVSSIQA